VFDGANLGLGVTPAAKFNIGSGGAARFNRSDNSSISYAEIVYAGSGVGLKFTDTNSDGFRFFNASTQAMTLDSNGNLLVGTTSSQAQLTVNNAIALAGSGAAKPASLGYGMYLLNGLGTVVYSSASTAFYTGTTETARIDSSGNLLVGQTGSTTGKISVQQTGTTACFFGYQTNGSSANGYQIQYATAFNNTTNEAFFFADGSIRATIRSNGGIANYSANNVNLSDRREKTNFAPAKSYLDVICAIPVQTYNYIDQNIKEDDGLTLGVVAQDVQAVAPELVNESDWSVEKDGSKMRLSIYQTDMQYALMKCIQELSAQVKTLQTQVTALKG
jgi:hypothetical protein